MRLLLQTLFFSLISLASVPSIAKLSTPDEIMQQVQERGVNSVVAELGEEYERNSIAHNISTGDNQWLQIAFKLYPNIHPKFSKQIRESLSIALINNPNYVLMLTTKHRNLSIMDICDIPSTINGSRQQKSFIRKVINSLKAAEKSSTRTNRDNIEMCLWEFEKMASSYL
ncbi:hypothetical protein Xmau_02366 [Xenorhabdus mauleonii]|uniref:Secreted protein n=1 Tax=Xenorhabdus mauleonii TaxID=351675 RepID=A0A1I3R7B7_9GAMM|nr:hypothetical protein [Xenorhabdus mauleonii]PHM39768.1 hypothetical protein Xmau_02366 [Xenorhabdus mauleonii]SFJ41930.1 hypothetical protein SAMN05421680_1091 [Xenorhabdus mauleonii]